MLRLLLTLLIATAWASPAFALQVSFKAETTVNTDFITLGDVAGFDEQSQLTEALASKIIARSPAPGETLYLNSLNIKNEILRKTTLSSYTLWTGASMVAVARDGQEVAPQQLIDAIEDYLAQHRQTLPRADIRFTPRSLPLPFMLPEGELAIEVMPSNGSILQSDRFSLLLRVNDKVEKNLSIQGELQALAEVVVAAGPLRRGTILTPRNTSLEVKDLTRYDDPLTNPRLVLGRRLKRSVRADNVIGAADIEIPPLVEKGQLVKIVLDQGNMHLTATGIAGSDGTANEIIRVRNARSNKLIYCRVAAPGIVEVQI